MNAVDRSPCSTFFELQEAQAAGFSLAEAVDLLPKCSRSGLVECVAVGVFQGRLAGYLHEYPEYSYRWLSEGTAMMSMLVFAESEGHAAALCLALGVTTYDFVTLEIHTQNVSVAALRSLEEEAADSFEPLAGAGFRFYLRNALVNGRRFGDP